MRIFAALGDAFCSAGLPRGFADIWSLAARRHDTRWQQPDTRQVSLGAAEAVIPIVAQSDNSQFFFYDASNACTVLHPVLPICRKD
jgi:uncharacterized membrane protein